MKRRDFLKSTAGVVVSLPLASQTLLPDYPQSARLPRRLLGRTGVEVSALALGGAGGMSQERSADHDPVAIAERAIELGINYFDTAPGYGRGRSETYMGPVVKAHRDDIFLASKVHYPRGYDNAMSSIEGSLERLRTDHIDLLQIHMVREEEDVSGWDEKDGVYRALQELKEQKVIRFIGITGHYTTGPLIEAIKLYDFDTVLATLNPTSNRKDYREKLLPVALEKNMGIVAMKVFGGGNGGLATGNPKEQKMREYHDDTPNQVTASELVRYVLGLPISTATVGVDSIAQLEANVKIAVETEPLTVNERRELEVLLG